MSTLDECLLRSMLGAEIRLGGDAPINVLTKLYESYPNEVTLLFARSSQKNADAILPLFEKEKTVTARWLALGDLLLEGKARHFPLVLMRQMQRIDLSIAVTDFAGEGGIGGSLGEGIDEFKVPIGFPPIAIHDLSIQPKRDATVIATGPRTIYANETIVHPGESITVRNGGGFVFDYWDSNAYRYEYLAAVLEELPKYETAFRRHLNLTWNGQKQFIADVNSHCSERLQKYDLILSLLQKKDLIAPSDARTLQPKIILNISDFRRNKAVPLPEIHLPQVTVEK
ncbi:MAG: hypothetical protein LAP85_29010 [Acidobacteriia bacterium]|nr:hypothetical protein [Terriglobia bacterium]